MDHLRAVDELEQASTLLDSIEFPEIHIAQYLLEAKTHINLGDIEKATND
jgi:hypothetical protein